jgi:hypothetical protein
MYNSTCFPRGQWKVDDETEPVGREIVAMEPPEGEEELEVPTNKQMAHPAMWVHALPNILMNCRTKHGDAEDPAEGGDEEFNAEEAALAMEAADPYEPRLKPITMDAKVRVSNTIS